MCIRDRHRAAAISTERIFFITFLQISFSIFTGPARLEQAEEDSIYAGSAAFQKEYYIHLYHFFQYGIQESTGGFT